MLRRTLLTNRRLFSTSSFKFGAASPSPQPKSSPFALVGAFGVGAALYFVMPRSEHGHHGDDHKHEHKHAVASAKTFKKENTTVVFVLGGPGAGKGTQCEKLVKDYGFLHLSAGDLLRAERNREGSQYGDLINHYIKEGLIVPMEITVALLENAMKESGKSRFLIDGFPRKMDQAEAFESKIVESDFVLYFECPDDVMLKRLVKRGETSGRVDDNEESIRKRFKTFHETSFPVIEYYSKLGRVKTVSCMNTPDNVYEQVKQIFDAHFSNKQKR